MEPFKSYKTSPCPLGQGVSEAPEPPAMTPQLAAYLSRKSPKSFAAKLRDLPISGISRLHNAIYDSALAGLSEGLSPEVVRVRLLEAAIEKGRSPWEGPREVRHAVSNAHRWLFDDDADLAATTYPKSIKSSAAGYDPAHLTKLANRQPGFDVDDLREKSTLHPDELTSAEFLYALFRRNEKVLIFDTYKSDGQYMWTRPAEGSPFDEDELEIFREPAQPNGVWFLCNPIFGYYLEIERLVSESNPTGSSRRAEENLSSYRYFLLESDEAPQELWLRALVQLPLPIVSVCTSGGRSLHSLIRFDAEDGDSWRKYRNEIVPELVRLGACKGTHSPAQLTRLPGCYRELTKQWQQLLFINPSADGTPICDQ